MESPLCSAVLVSEVLPLVVKSSLSPDTLSIPPALLHFLHTTYPYMQSHTLFMGGLACPPIILHVQFRMPGIFSRSFTSLSPLPRRLPEQIFGERINKLMVNNQVPSFPVQKNGENLCGASAPTRCP